MPVTESISAAAKGIIRLRRAYTPGSARKEYLNRIVGSPTPDWTHLPYRPYLPAGLAGLPLSCRLFPGFVEYPAKTISHDQVLSILERHGNDL